MKVSVFRNFNQVESNLDLAVILEQIKSGKYKARIQALRELLRQGLADEYASAKRSLPAFTPSGLFEGGRKLEFLQDYSGLLVLDFDDLDQEPLSVAILKTNDIHYTYASFISPSGRGLKVLVKVFSRPVFHKSAFNQVKTFYEEALGITVDPSGKDITRLCFVSWDEMLYHNPSAAVFQTHINMVEDDIEKVVRQIEDRRLDLTQEYDQWVRIGFALADAIGEEGRSYFHRLSRFYPGYDPKACDDQFDKCLKSNNTGITIATLFYYARDHGVDISRLRTTKPDAGVQTSNNREHSPSKKRTQQTLKGLPSEPSQQTQELQGKQAQQTLQELQDEQTQQTPQGLLGISSQSGQPDQPEHSVNATNDPIPGEITNESQLKKKKRKNQVDAIEAYLSEHYDLRFNTVTSKLEIRKKQIEPPPIPTTLDPTRHASPVTRHDFRVTRHDSCPASPVTRHDPCHASRVTRHDSCHDFHPLTDYHENSLLREILKSNLKCSAALLRSILYSDFSHYYDPFRDYFLHLPLWDGQTDYIQQLAETVQSTAHELWCQCFKKWLVASVAAVLDSDTVNHTAIILSGGQGIGKTTWLLNLCPPELTDYIFSGTINPNNKDTLIHLTECMFINMDELENMNRTEIGAFKEVITKSAIRMRRAYGHHIEAFTRRASFMGSVNSSQFLTDSTGSRRFLCFEILSIDYRHTIDLQLVYAQAYDLFQQGLKFYFDKDEIQAITESNEQFQINTVEEELLLTYFQKVPLNEATTFLSAAQILNRITERTHVNIVTSPGAVIRLGKALKKFGFEKRKTDGLFLWAINEK